MKHAGNRFQEDPEIQGEVPSRYVFEIEGERALERGVLTCSDLPQSSNACIDSQAAKMFKLVAAELVFFEGGRGPTKLMSPTRTL